MIAVFRTEREALQKSWIEDDFGKGGDAFLLSHSRMLDEYITTS